MSLPRKKNSMNDLLESCPVCNGQEFKNISTNLLLCKKCRILFNTEWAPVSYSKDYFISEYTAQYGKTYIEDFDNIYALASTRLDKIFRHIPFKPQLSILDIGSAAGFFLKAAQDRGVKNLTGIEISGFASSWCRDNFNIDVFNTPFDIAPLNKRYSIITAWFFLEHTPDPLSTLEEIHLHLEDNGILALAIPSWFGPLFFLQRKLWIKTRPVDHKIDVSPGSVKKMLNYADFEILSINRCGYHPERIIKKESFLYPLFEPLYNVFTRITSFSDTIEVYARKKN